MRLHRRAFVIGLGRYADPILQATESVFTEYFRPTAGESLPLAQARLLDQVPVTSAGFHAECFDMSLSVSQLSALYFDPHVRNWSSFNWQHWGEALPSTRLAGRLAAYHHAKYLEKSLSTWFKHTNTGAPVSIYLIAPLHDPFASGAVFDISYQLAQLARQNQAKFNAILILPDTMGDPVESQDTDKNAADHTALRHATTYAALRELAFITGGHGFDISHRSPEDFSQSQFIHHLSPFIHGDCYLVGGSTREGDAGDDAPPLTYDDLRQECARFIFLQTQTALGDALQSEDNQRGLATVSTFSAIALSPEQHSTSTSNRRDNNALTLWTLELLRGQSPNADNSPFFDSDTIQIPNISPSAPPFDEVDDVSEKTAYDRLRQDERRQQDDIMTFRTTAKRISDESRAQQDRLTERWEKELNQRLASPDMRLSALEQAIENSKQILEQRYSQAERLSDDAERAALGDAARLTIARANYSYLINRDIHHPVFIIFACATGIALAVLMWTLGQGFLSLMWIAFAFTLPWLISGWRRNQRESQSALVLHDHRAKFIGIQSEIAQKRAQSAHLYELKEHFDTDIAKRVQQMSDLATQLRTELRARGVQTTLSAPPVDTAKLTRVALRILDEAVRKQWSVASVLARLNSQLSDEFSLSQQSETDASVHGIYRTLRQAGLYSPMLRVERAQISEGDRNSISTNVGLVNYDAAIVTALNATSDVTSYGKASFSDLTADWPHHGNDPMYVLIRRCMNIPLRALRDIEIYQTAYRRLGMIADQNHAVRARAYFHPTRWGVASPDILRQPADITVQQPDFVQLLLISLRLGTEPERHNSSQKLMDEGSVEIAASKARAKTRLVELCQQLGVASQPDIDYDALCGALCESPHLINEWVRQVSSDDQRTVDSDFNLVQKAQEYLNHKPPKLSETYADWEIIAAHRLRAFKNRESSTVYRTLERVVAKHFASDGKKFTAEG